jgi:hypothetical protein
MNGRLLMARHQPRVREKAVALPHPASMSCIAHVTSQPAVVGAVHRCHGARARARGDIAACARPPLKQLAKKGDFAPDCAPIYTVRPWSLFFLPSLCARRLVLMGSQDARLTRLSSLSHTHSYPSRGAVDVTQRGVLCCSRAAPPFTSPKGAQESRHSVTCSMARRRVATRRARRMGDGNGVPSHPCGVHSAVRCPTAARSWAVTHPAHGHSTHAVLRLAVRARSRCGLRRRRWRR